MLLIVLISVTDKTSFVVSWNGVLYVDIAAWLAFRSLNVKVLWICELNDNWLHSLESALYSVLSLYYVPTFKKKQLNL